jgi:hypothetical protein
MNLLSNDEGQMTKAALQCGGRIRHSDFGLPSDFVIRHSDLDRRFMESPLSFFPHALGP